MGEIRSILFGVIVIAGITAIQGYGCNLMGILNIAIELEKEYDIQLGEAAQILGSFDNNEETNEFITVLLNTLEHKISNYHGNCPEPLEKGLVALRFAVKYALNLTSTDKNMPFPGECRDVDRLRKDVLRCNVQVYESVKADPMNLFKPNELCKLGSDLMTCVDRAMDEARCSNDAIYTIRTINKKMAAPLSDWGDCAIESRSRPGYDEDAKIQARHNKCDWEEMNRCALKLEKDFGIELGEAALTFSYLAPQQQGSFCREFQGNFSRCINSNRWNCPDFIENALDGIEEAGKLICGEVSQGKLSYPNGCESHTLQVYLSKCNFRTFDGYALMRAVLFGDNSYICKSVNELFECVDEAMRRARCDPQQAYIMHKADSLMFERFASHVDNCEVRPEPMWMRKRDESEESKLENCFAGTGLKSRWIVLAVALILVAVLSTVICCCVCKRRRGLRQQEKAVSAETVCAKALPEKQPLGEAVGEEVVLKVPTGEENVSCSNPLYDLTQQQEVLPTYSEANIPPPAYNAQDP